MTDLYPNPFPASDPLRHALWETHMRQDIEAFLRGDWEAVAGDFDEQSFVAIDAGRQADPAQWTIGFPSLAAYRDTWLRMSAETIAKADPEKLKAAMFAGARIARIDFYGPDTALLHKRFNGLLPLRDGGEEPYSWQSVFTLRNTAAGWKIVSFVGYLPGRA